MLFLEKKKVKYVIATLYIQKYSTSIEEQHSKRKPSKVAAERRRQRAQFLHLPLSFMYYKNSMQSVRSLDVPVLLNSCENSDQRAELVYLQVISHTSGQAQSSLAIWMRAPAWRDIYMPHIADASPFHKESSSLEVRTMTKNSPKKQTLSKRQPVYFFLVFSMILRSYRVCLQVSPFEVKLEQKLC